MIFFLTDTVHHNIINLGCLSVKEDRSDLLYIQKEDKTIYNTSHLAGLYMSACISKSLDYIVISWSSKVITN